MWEYRVAGYLAVIAALCYAGAAVSVALDGYSWVAAVYVVNVALMLGASYVNFKMARE